MSEPSIAIEHVSKRFKIGAAHTGYSTLRDRFSGLFRRRAAGEHDATELWALRDVTFDIAEGEALGMIGHNGAGKSTILKILSRITEPTEGKITIRGRVGSLLEVGTGFHPELTGRENIFLNGAILGMTRAEIRRNFDAIVAFAEIERFLETPVKRFSSGMYVRLAFAVAAYLTPEVLLVDEVLAVGDVNFQRRCLGRMGEVARSGRTVVFVSHNLASIERLCERTVLFSAGRVLKHGATSEVIAYYVSDRGKESASADLSDFPDREGTGRAHITALQLLSEGGEPIDVVEFGQSFAVRITYRAFERVESPFFAVGLLNEKNERLVLAATLEAGLVVEAIEGDGFIDCYFQSPNLLPGVYYLEAWITDETRMHFADRLRMVGKFEIVVGENARDNVTELMLPDRGVLWLASRWKAGG